MVVTTIERKLRSTKVRLFTVPCCSIIPFSSEGMKQFLPQLTPIFFRRSIIIVCSIIVFSSIFLTFTYIYQFCSIISFRGLLINFAESPFYNSGFYVTFFRGPRKIHKMMQIYVRLCK